MTKKKKKFWILTLTLAFLLGILLDSFSLFQRECREIREDVLRLRFQMIKNACAVLMCSRGTPMFFAGDEFGNTQYGNNNAYCQDNEISWLDWGRLDENREIFDFFRYMIGLRRSHEILRKNTEPCQAGFPPVSLHGTQPWEGDYTEETKTIGIMYAGRDQEGHDDILYLGINAYWESVEIWLPVLREGFCWTALADTSRGEQAVIRERVLLDQRRYVMHPRSVCVFQAVTVSGSESEWSY